MSEGDQRVDVVVVGAGFAGLYMLHRLRKQNLTTRVIEAGDGVGGTWYWNRYPGARCDVQSLEYSYGWDDELQQDWDWSERYASQPEILAYLNHVADRFDLRRDITFGTRVTSAVFDEDRARWNVVTDKGDEIDAKYLVTATGCLSSANIPDIPGRDEFEGPTYHTGQWPHDGVDFTGLKVGIIGTGSSAVQSIPIIAEQADQLVVFQRTPTYSVPAHNGPLDPAEVEKVKASYGDLRAANKMAGAGFGGWSPPAAGSATDFDGEELERILEERWAIGGLSFLGGFTDLLLNPQSNEVAAEFVRNKIRQIVKDPVTAEKLVPKQVIGCKRLCVDTGYYETYNRDNVELVDLQETPIERITASGIATSDQERAFDAIVFATGFDAMTGALLKMDIRGRGGQPLREAWEAGPVTYLGLGVPGFPNMFIVTGPGSPSVLTNMVTSIEQHVEWIDACIAHLEQEDLDTIEASGQAADEWVGYVNAVAGITLFPSCSSWYLGANVPGKPRVFMPLPGFPPYAQKCEQVAADGYAGFELGRASVTAS